MITDFTALLISNSSGSKNLRMLERLGVQWISKSMKVLKTYLVFLMGFAFSQGATAAQEENYIVGNGQGVSSPGYWGGVSNENPAGMIFNESSKVQIGAGSHSEPGWDYQYGSGGILMGNGLLGAGVEYENYGNGKLNWAIAGRFQAINSAFGLSARTTLGGKTFFNLGVILEPLDKFRIGIIVPNLTGTIDSFAAGVTYQLDSMFDLVIDADYSSTASIGHLKPGVTFHYNWLHATAAYGLNYLANSNFILKNGFAIGLGAKVMKSALVSYQFQETADHRLGLTLRFN